MNKEILESNADLLAFCIKLRDLYDYIGTKDNKRCLSKFLSQMYGDAHERLVANLPNIKLSRVILEMNQSTIKHYIDTGDKTKLLFSPSLAFKLALVSVFIRHTYFKEVGSQNVNSISLYNALSDTDIDNIQKLNPNVLIDQLKNMGPEKKNSRRRKAIRALMDKVYIAYGIKL